jgi:hypothetical protein
MLMYALACDGLPLKSLEATTDIADEIGVDQSIDNPPPTINKLYPVVPSACKSRLKRQIAVACSAGVLRTHRCRIP